MLHVVSSHCELEKYVQFTVGYSVMKVHSDDLDAPFQSNLYAGEIMIGA
jgi:hypothetical protein